QRHADADAGSDRRFPAGAQPSGLTPLAAVLRRGQEVVRLEERVAFTAPERGEPIDLLLPRVGKQGRGVDYDASVNRRVVVYEPILGIGDIREHIIERRLVRSCVKNDLDTSR